MIPVNIPVTWTSIETPVEEEVEALLNKVEADYQEKVDKSLMPSFHLLTQPDEIQTIQPWKVTFFYLFCKHICSIYCNHI